MPPGGVVERIGDTPIRPSASVESVPGVPVTSDHGPGKLHLAQEVYDRLSNNVNLAWSDPMKKMTVFYLVGALLAFVVAVVAFVFLWRQLNRPRSLRAYLREKTKEAEGAKTK